MGLLFEMLCGANTFTLKMSAVIGVIRLVIDWVYVSPRCPCARFMQEFVFFVSDSREELPYLSGETNFAEWLRCRRQVTVSVTM